jgi:hypothetical protein
MLALLMPFFGPIVDKLVGMIPDPAAQEKARAEAMAQIISAAQAADQAQNDVNKTEAASGSIFVAGWRPFIGWVCGAALAFQYIIRPLATMALTAMHRPDIILPGLDDNLWQLMLGMLGMGGLRTFEKVKGVLR